MTDAAARAVDLFKQYGSDDTAVIALDHVSIEFGKNQFTAIMGPSGSGKSTLIDAFSAVLVPPGKLRFNAAAQQETGRDKGRSRVSYIRGAWRRSEDPATGEIRSVDAADDTAPISVRP